jgi:hypothetical protein
MLRASTIASLALLRYDAGACDVTGAKSLAASGSSNEVKSRSGAIIDSTSEVGGWPSLAKNTRTFNVSNPSGDDDGDGYTNIEEVLHQMAAQVEGKASM